MPMKKNIIQLAIPTPLRRSFDYLHESTVSYQSGRVCKRRLAEDRWLALSRRICTKVIFQSIN